MILGLLSDSHGRVQRTAAAIRLLGTLGAERFVHCGDVGGEDVLALLAEHAVSFVWGNTDLPTSADINFARSLGLTPPAAIPLRLSFGQTVCLVFHGHERQFETLLRAVHGPDAAVARAALDGAKYIFYGHTHYASESRVGDVRFINPGALHRVATPTVATLDLDTDALAWWVVDESGGEPRPFVPRPSASS